jgi:hypothetical protein
MHRFWSITCGGIIATALLLVGCGGGGSGTVATTPADDAAAGEVQVTSGPYQPMVVGAQWLYHVNDKGVKYDKQAVFETQEDEGGPKAGTQGFRMKETMPATTQLTWYSQQGDVVARDHVQSLDATGALTSEDWYDPYRLRVDSSAAHTTAGASWTWTFNDTHSSRTKPTATNSLTEGWKCEAVDEPVTVPGGTFAALRLTHIDPTDGSTKTYWFVKGVGKVREETSAGHIEEMASYSVPSQ